MKFENVIWKMSDIGLMCRSVYIVFKRLLFVNIECWNVKCHQILLILLLFYSILSSFAVQVTYICVYEGQNNISWFAVAIQVPEWDTYPFPLNIPWTHIHAYEYMCHGFVSQPASPLCCTCSYKTVNSLVWDHKTYFVIKVCILWLIAGAFDQLGIVTVLFCFVLVELYQQP